jgi:hypothetical protein
MAKKHRRISSFLRSDLSAIDPSAVAVIILIAAGLLCEALLHSRANECYRFGNWCSSNLYRSGMVWSFILAAFIALYHYRARISHAYRRLLRVAMSLRPAKRRQAPSKSTMLAAVFLGVMAYLVAVAAAIMATTNARDYSNSWGGACGQLPTMVDHTAQYSTLAICAAALGLLISLAYKPKNMRFIGALVLAATIFSYFASDFTAHFHLCF